MTLPETAIAAVTKPSNMSSFAPLGSSARAVNEHKVVAEICEVTGVSQDEGRKAAREALAEVGGHVERRRQRGGIAAGRMRVHLKEVWWVPRDALRV